MHAYHVFAGRDRPEAPGWRTHNASFDDKNEALIHARNLVRKHQADWAQVVDITTETLIKEYVS